MRTDISALLEATVAGDNNAILAAGRELLQRGAEAAELIGRMGMIAAHGDSDGHAILTLSAASAISRWLIALPQLPEQNGQSHERGLPLLVQASVATAPAVRAGKDAHDTYPEPFYPSEMPEGKMVDEKMHDAVYGNDATLVERLLLGLYGTGADYRTMEVRTYDGISTTFQNAGHPLMFAVRGFQPGSIQYVRLSLILSIALRAIAHAWQPPEMWKPFLYADSSSAMPIQRRFARACIMR